MWGRRKTYVVGEGKRSNKVLKCALKAISCSYEDSDSGLEGIFESIWSPFQGAPSTTIWDAPTSKDSQGWIAHSSERELIHGWANLGTRQSFSPGTCLPYFLSSGSNLTRAWLDEMPAERGSQGERQPKPSPG